jgi:hypothetical protein
MMRRICLTVLVVALAVPALALAADRATGDGSLGLSAVNGTIVVHGKGVIYGHFDQGTLIVMEYRPDGLAQTPSVSNAKSRSTRNVTVYTGSNVRFLLPSGRYAIELIATGVDASAVGKGNVSATGFGTFDDGSVTVNGGRAVALSSTATMESFGGGTGASGFANSTLGSIGKGR